MQWHPDKHPEDPEGAKAKFQEIQRAFTSLMTTDEDEEVSLAPVSKHLLASLHTGCTRPPPPRSPPWGRGSCLRLGPACNRLSASSS